MAPKPRTTTSYATGMFTSSNAGEMTGAPFTNRIDDRHKAAAHRRQAIVDLGRDRAVVAAVDPAADGQCLGLAAQHPGRDLRRAVAAAQQAAPDLAVAPRAILEVPQDTDLVLAAHHLLESQHRTAAARAFARTAYTIIFVHTCAPAPMSYCFAIEEERHEAISHQVSPHHRHDGGLAPRDRVVHRLARRRSGAQGQDRLSLHEGPRRRRLLPSRHGVRRYRADRPAGASLLQGLRRRHPT